MEIKTRRSFFGKIAAMAAVVISAPKLLAQQAPPSVGSPAPGTTPAAGPGGDGPRRAGAGNHTHNGIYYFSGTGSNDGYPKDDHVLVTDPFEKHVTRTMDALKKSVERAGCTMDSIINLQVFLCLPLADGIPMPTGKARHRLAIAALEHDLASLKNPEAREQVRLMLDMKQRHLPILKGLAAAYPRAAVRT